MSILHSDNERTSKIKKNVVIMLGIKGVSLLISLLYVPLLLHSMNAVNYGIWLTLTSLIAWISMFDIGLGNGLRNKLSIALANGNKQLGRTYVSTAYICISALVLILIILFVAIQQFVSWQDILNATAVDKKQLDLLVFIVFAAFGLLFVLNLINSILLAMQMPAFSSFILMAGQLFSFIVVFILVKIFHVNSLLILGGTISLIPPAVMLVSSIILFKSKYKDISPSFKYFNIYKIKDILSLGIKFFIIQIITIVLYQTNNLIITHTVGNSAVVEYNVAYKYMHVLVMVFTIIVTPLWSATTEAYTKKDFAWIKGINRQMRKIVVIMACIGLVMLIVSKQVYEIWLGNNELNINFSTSMLLYIYSIFMIMYGNYGYILNGIGKLQIQIYATLILAMAYIPAAIFAGRFWGLNGILLMFALSPMVNYIWSKIQFIKLINGSATGIWNR